MFSRSNVTLKVILLFVEFLTFCLTVVSLVFHITTLHIDDVDRVFPARLALCCDILLCISVVAMYSGIILELPRLVVFVFFSRIFLAVTPDAYHLFGYEWNLIWKFHIYTILRAGYLGMFIMYGLILTLFVFYFKLCSKP